MADPVRVLLVTGGHPFEREPFLDVFAANEAITHRHVEQPVVLSPGMCSDSDVIVFYDMPGVEFTGADPPVTLLAPPDEVVAGFEALCAAGKPMIFLHHAIAGWPAWDGYARMIGGRFHYQPASLDGADYPDSGYRFDVTHEVEVVALDHPLCAGVASTFAITDELYLFPVLEATVTPLMRSRASFVAERFFSADQAIRGRRESQESWTHPDGSDLVAWTRQAANSTVVYIQFGDGPQTYADPNYRRILANAITWAATTSPSG